MSMFMSEKLIQIDLNEKFWVKIKEEVSWDDFTQIIGITNNLDIGKVLIPSFVKEWNIKDDNGKDVELNDKNLMNLKTEYLLMIQAKVMEKIDDQKKSVERTNKKKEEKPSSSQKQSKAKNTVKGG